MIRLQLEVKGSSREYAFSRTRIRIGRSPMNDLTIPVEGISARHATLHILEDGTVVFTDLDSLGGSTIKLGDDETAIKGSTPLNEGTQVTLGEAATLRVLTAGAASIELGRIPLGDQGPAVLGAVFAGRLAHIALEHAADPSPTAFLRGVPGLISSAAGVEVTAVMLLKRSDGTQPEQLLGLVDGAVQGVARDGAFARFRERLIDALGEPGLYHYPIGSGRRLIVSGRLSGESGSLSLVVDVSPADCISEPDETEVWGLVAAQLLPFLDSITRADRHGTLEAHLRAENQYFRDRQRRHYLFKEIVAESDAMRALYKQLHAHVDGAQPVLITGEAGVGKELIARAVHHLGSRSDGLLVAQNCADLNEHQLDGELFGNSGVGADRTARLGIIELASGGTVYLGEIDRLSPFLQSKLLRVINEAEVRRHGEEQARAVDVRFVLSTHRNLIDLVADGAFRKDLYVAISAAVVEVPPLRRRQRDIVPLARTFAAVFARRYGVPVPTFSKSAVELLTGYSFPGNIRELQTVVEAGVLKRRGAEELEAEDLAIQA